MRQLTIAAATVAIAAMISAVPASADYLGGGPRKQNGQCWKGSKGLRDLAIGTHAHSPPATARQGVEGNRVNLVNQP